MSGRKQIVRLNGALSKPISVTTGVPQGSHLGPLLFIIFINDIKGRIIFCKVLLFADDLKLFWAITCLADCQMLQADLHAIFAWSIENDLHFNLEKCSFITFSRSSTTIQFNYTLAGTELGRADTIKDLGIIHDKRLNFHSHLESVSSKAHRALGFISRNTKEFGDKDTIKYLYQTLVLPHLTYCCQIWSPQVLYRKKILESAQHRFVRSFLYRFSTPMDWTDHVFQPRLAELRLPTISSRHTSLGNSFVFNTLNGRVNSQPIIDMFKPRHVSYSLRNPHLLELDPNYNANYLVYSAKYRLSRSWNELPAGTRATDSKEKFNEANKKICCRYS